MSLAQTPRHPKDGERGGVVADVGPACTAARDRDHAGARARPTSISAQPRPVLQPGKPLTAKEQAAAEEAKAKLERMVKQFNYKKIRYRFVRIHGSWIAGRAHERVSNIVGRIHCTVDALVAKRKKFFSYLKNTHADGGFWLNCVRLTRQGDIAVYAADLPPQRVLRLFYLGIGLAKLLQAKGGAQLIRGILQLLEEWEYHFALAGVAHHSVKAMLAKNIDGPSRDTMSSRGDDDDKQHEQLVARLLKFNNEVVYQHLLTPEVPFALDYLEVVFSLCDIMCRVYAKFIEEECYKNGFVYDGLVKVDNKIKHHIINVFAKEFTDISTSIARDELKTLR